MNMTRQEFDGTDFNLQPDVLRIIVLNDSMSH
jgi:hypothetical protein